MGNQTENNHQQHQQQQQKRKPRFLGLHGFRTNGEILKKQVGKWPESVLSKIDVVFVDAPFPAEGKSDVEGIFDPPYYEWFQFDKNFTEYRNFDECLASIENYMLKHGPFDGLLGFSQGAILSAALPGLQSKGLALTKVPKIKFLIIIGGAKFLSLTVADKAYASPIDIPSLHFLGEMDFLMPHGKKLLESCVDPVVIHHPKGHTIPRLDEKGLEIMFSFLERIQCIVCSTSCNEEPTSVNEKQKKEEKEKESSEVLGCQRIVRMRIGQYRIRIRYLLRIFFGYQTKNGWISDYPNAKLRAVNNKKK